MAYDAKEFDVDAVLNLLNEVMEGTADNSDALHELGHDLKQIRAHCTKLISECYDRADELDGDEDEDEEEDVAEDEDEDEDVVLTRPDED
jgi:hypothetical protein